jgi:hypothetical protein
LAADPTVLALGLLATVYCFSGCVKRGARACIRHTIVQVRYVSRSATRGALVQLNLKYMGNAERVADISGS